MEYTFLDCSLEDVLFVLPGSTVAFPPISRTLLPSNAAGCTDIPRNLLAQVSSVDTSTSFMRPFTFSEKVTHFIGKNWLGIIVTLTIVGGFYIYNKNKEKEREQR